MEKLDDFLLVESIFKDIGISPNWLHALSIGYTKIYDGAILNYYIENNVCIINSGSIDNKRFSKTMIADIIKLIKSHKKAIISSEVGSIEKFLQKYGFYRDEKRKLYIKGL